MEDLSFGSFCHSKRVDCGLSESGTTAVTSSEGSLFWFQFWIALSGWSLTVCSTWEPVTCLKREKWWNKLDTASKWNRNASISYAIMDCGIQDKWSCKTKKKLRDDCKRTSFSGNNFHFFRNVAARKTPIREAPFIAEKNVFVHLQFLRWRLPKSPQLWCSWKSPFIAQTFFLESPSSLPCMLSSSHFRYLQSFTIMAAKFRILLEWALINDLDAFLPRLHLPSKDLSANAGSTFGNCFWRTVCSACKKSFRKIKTTIGPLLEEWTQDFGPGMKDVVM